MKNTFLHHIADRIKPEEQVCPYSLNPSVYPLIYNPEGKKMEIWYLSGKHPAKSPYGYKSKYFLWDNSNSYLKTHFYIDDSIYKQKGSPDRKYGLIHNKNFKFKKGIEKDFNLIFTYDEKLLQTLNNARFFPSCAKVSYGRINGNIGNLNKFVYLNKVENISIKSSVSKIFNSNINNYVKVFPDTTIVDNLLTNFRYSIVTEDCISDYYFTEKILDCFASMTIPIYYGARKIDEFFNPDGIIKISKNDLGNIDEILKDCCEKNYEERFSAVKENFETVKNYINIDDYLYEKYFI